MQLADHATAGRRREWRPVGRVPLPSHEPGRVELVALLNGPGGPRHGKATAWDDRVEAGVCALGRYLWRLGHAHRSAAYATSIAQLVDGLQPTFHWRTPATGQKAVRRWLALLAEMRVVAAGGVRDNLGLWWRTEVRLLPTPAADERWLAAAQARVREFPRRERRRRQRCPGRNRRLQRAVAASKAPSPTAIRRQARERCRAAHERLVAAQGVLSYPSGAPPTSEDVNSSGDTQNASHLAPTFIAPPTSETQIREDAISGADSNEPESVIGVREEDPPVVRVAFEAWRAAQPTAPTDTDALMELMRLREAAIAAGLAPPTRFHVIAATRRAAFDALEKWPPGRSVPLRLAADAFEHVTGSSAKVRRDGSLEPRLRRALARYERYADERPAGWPVSAGAALTQAMAEAGDEAESVNYVVNRLNFTAKQMAAQAKRRDVDGELERRRDRAARRGLRGQRSRLAFRKPVTGLPAPGTAAPEHVRRTAMEMYLRGELTGIRELFGFMGASRTLLNGDPAASAQAREAYRGALGYVVNGAGYGSD